MAAGAPCDSQSLNHSITVPNRTDKIEQNQTQVTEDDSNINYWQRAQWLRAAVLGANDGLVSIASLMMGVGAVKKDAKAMLLSGFAGLVAGACGMAIGEYVSVYTQYEIEIGQTKRDMELNDKGELKDLDMELEKRKSLPNPLQAALASALAFSVGGLVPLIFGAFIKVYKLRLLVIVAAASLASVVFGGVGAHLGKTPVLGSISRFLIGGWLAMATTFAVTKLLGSYGLDL